MGQAEEDFLYNILDEKLPLCKELQHDVLRKHGSRFENHGNLVGSLRRKFTTSHRKKILTEDPLMSDDKRRAKDMQYKMSERTDFRVDEATADDYFLDDTDPTTESVISEPDAHDDNESASTPPITLLLTTPANTNHAASGDAAGEVERGSRPLLN